jgi:ABC-type transport system involved in multi-copper enzyme maturation permease subunit
MKALTHAEVLKLRSTRMPAGLLLATLAMVTLTAAVNVPKKGDQKAPVPLDDPSLLAVTVGNSFGVPIVLMLLLGGVACTQEFRYGTVTSTYLVEPRRTRILLAKSVTLALVGIVVTAATLVVSVPFSAALIGSRDGEVSLGAQFWQMVAAGFVVMALLGVIGVAIGALVRNQITAVVGVLVWMLVVEQIVVSSYPVVGRWMPGATTFVLLQMGPAVDPDGKLLSASASGLLLAAYTAVAVALALRLTPKRDVL